jgi:hypothetical protein
MAGIALDDDRPSAHAITHPIAGLAGNNNSPIRHAFGVAGPGGT